MKDLPTYGNGIGDAIQGASASCTSVNVDLQIVHNNKQYTWWGNFDSKWQMEEVYNDDNDVTDEEFEAVSTIAKHYLEHEYKGTTKLNELLDNVIYEG